MSPSVRPIVRVHLMTSSNRAVSQLTTANLMIGGIAILGWIALGVVALLDQFPQDWLVQLRHVPDAIFFAILLTGPAGLVAGFGLRKRRRWARLLTLILGAIAGVLAILGVVLAGFGVLQASGPADFAFFSLFAAYGGAVFVILWNKDGEKGSG
jgi:hypothetical protein